MIELYLPSEIEYFSSRDELFQNISLSSNDTIITSESLQSVLLPWADCDCNWILVEKTRTAICSNRTLSTLCAQLSDTTTRLITFGSSLILEYTKMIAHQANRHLEVILIPTTFEAGREFLTEILINKNKCISTVQVDAVNACYLCKDLQTTMSLSDLSHGSLMTLIYAAESFISPQSTNFTRLFSREALQLTLQNFRKMVFHSAPLDDGMKEDLLFANAYTGIARTHTQTSLFLTIFDLLPNQYCKNSQFRLQLFLHFFHKYMVYKPNGKIQELYAFIANQLNCPKSSALQELQSICDCILPRNPLHFELEHYQKHINALVKTLTENDKAILEHAYFPLSADDLIDIFMRINC